MRSEKEMLELILGVARADERIRAVCQNGSRTNPHARKDLFCDYDIVYIVRETRPFYTDPHWIDRFGQRLYLQRPEEIDRGLGLDVDFDRSYGWLIQLADGNRLDLHVQTADAADPQQDGLCLILLDKDSLFPSAPAPTDAAYWVKQPTQAQFCACCSEFWWCLNNIAKGLWRRELPYAHAMFYRTCHPQLLKLLSWRVGFERGFTLSVGKSCKYLQDFLPAPLWERLCRTYFHSDLAQLWESVDAACLLFHETALYLQAQSGLVYDAEEAEASHAFFRHVRTLPQDAQSIF